MPAPVPSELVRVYRRLCEESPEADPVDMARLAGFQRPESAVKRLANLDLKKARRAEQEATDAAQGITPDRAKALRALRSIAQSGKTPSSRVAAAKALMEATPAPLSDKGRVLVVFRGRESDSHQRVLADVDPQVLAAAIEAAAQQREAAHDAQIQEHAIRFAIDPEELSLAWELWQHTEARAAGLRVLMLSDRPLAKKPTPAPTQEAAPLSLAP